MDTGKKLRMSLSFLLEDPQIARRRISSRTPQDAMYSPPEPIHPDPSDAAKHSRERSLVHSAFGSRAHGSPANFGQLTWKHISSPIATPPSCTAPHPESGSVSENPCNQAPENPTRYSLASTLSPVSSSIRNSFPRSAESGLDSDNMNSSNSMSSVVSHPEMKSEPQRTGQTSSNFKDSRIQKHKRQTRCKRMWTQEEDELLRRVAGEAPENWNLIGLSLRGRTGKQCRERWLNNLRPDIRKGGWSKEEDDIILREQATRGNQWSSIARLLVGRSDNAIKNRFASKLKKRAYRTSGHYMTVGAKEITTSPCTFWPTSIPRQL